MPQRLELDGATLRRRAPRNGAEQRLHLSQRLRWIDRAGDDEDRIVGTVPRAVKVAQHGRRGFFERVARAQPVRCVRRALERRCVQRAKEDVGRIGIVLRNLLLDGPALVLPIRLIVDDAAHAARLDAQRDFEIVGRHRKVVLRDRGPRVGVDVASEFRADRRQLIAGQAEAAAKQHVFLRVRHARKIGRRFIRAGQIVHLGRHDGADRVANDGDPKPVVERCAEHVAGILSDCGVPRCSAKGADRDCDGGGFYRNVHGHSVSAGWDLARLPRTPTDESTSRTRRALAAPKCGRTSAPPASARQAASRSKRGP